MQWEHVLLWLGVMIVLSILEASTVTLVGIWFALSAVLSLIAALLGAQFWLQLVLCLVGGLALLAFTRPLAQRYINSKRISTNADRVIGQSARVTERIDNSIPSGAVYVLGKEWTARSEDGNVLSEETLVTVERIDGVKLWVKTP